MKIHNMEQGTAEWIKARLGIPTASNFDKILTPGGKLSKQADKFAYRLAAEHILKRQLDSLDHIEHIQRGKDLEPEAFRNYEFLQEVKLQKVGFITTNDGLIGASPDALIVGANAGCEFKCPNETTHIGYMIEGFGDDYKVQSQGQLYVCEFEYVDRYSYHPEFPHVLNRSVRDEPYIKLLKDSLDQFCDKLAKIIRTVKASGYFEERESIKTAHDAAYGEAA